MKKIFIIFIMCLFACFINKTIAFENGIYKVIKVIDGDTLFLDFNNDGIPQQEEKVRINGIDTFEVKPSVFLDWQMKQFNLNQREALGLGYFGKEFAKKNLLNKYVKAEYTSDTKLCDMGRQLMSIYYQPLTPALSHKGRGGYLNYEQEVLKAGLATVYKKSNLAPELYKYDTTPQHICKHFQCNSSASTTETGSQVSQELNCSLCQNLDKLRNNIEKTNELNLVLLNKKNGKYHKPTCEYCLMASNVELVNKKLKNKMLADCCNPDYVKPIDGETGEKSEFVKTNSKKVFFKHYDKPVPNYKSDVLELYLIDPTKTRLPANYPKTAAAQALLKDLKNANEIGFAVYGFYGQPERYNSIVKAKKDGKKIYGITDMDENNHNIYPDTQPLMNEIGTIKTDYMTTKRLTEIKSAYLKSKEAKGDFKGNVEYAKYFIEGKEVDVKTVSKAPLPIQEGIMHDKYFVINDDITWTGSTNISSSCIGGFNANGMIRVKSKEFANVYKQDLSQMYDSELFSRWKIPTHNNTNIKLSDETMISAYFCPQDKPMKEAILPLIQKSKKYIYVMTFYLNDPSFAQELINAKSRGVDVKVILDANGAHNDYTKHHILRQAGIPVKVENFGGKMHLKSIIVDDEAFVMGSMNFTGSAQTKNNENTNIVWNKGATEKFKEYFLRLYKKIPDKCLYVDVRAESFDSKGTCNDGIDNDHDGLVDWQSPYCKVFRRNYK